MKTLPKMEINDQLDARINEVLGALLLVGPRAQMECKALVRGIAHRPVDADVIAGTAEHIAAVRAPFSQYSILFAGHELKVPVTVHVAIGTDIIHMHPSANGAAIGQACRPPQGGEAE